jgi:hypothetical protein
MTTELRRCLNLALLTLPLSALPVSVPASERDASRAYRFDVFLDDRRIGEHHFEVSGAPGAERVRSKADFEFKLLFVTLYRYRHTAEEAWREGCLTDLRSTTDDNGQAFEVEAATRGAGLEMIRRKPDRNAEVVERACPVTFPYWDLARMSADAMINPQDGAMAATRLIREAAEQVDGVDAVRYRLEIDGMSDIRLWYRADDNRWLRLATHRDGRLLEYRR